MKLGEIMCQMILNKHAQLHSDRTIGGSKTVLKALETQSFYGK